jgi:hypothetical protein
MKYKVRVSRFFEFTTELEVEANSEDEADEIALRIAGQSTATDCDLSWLRDSDDSDIIETILDEDEEDFVEDEEE